MSSLPSSLSLASYWGPLSISRQENFVQRQKEPRKAAGFEPQGPRGQKSSWRRRWTKPA